MRVISGISKGRKLVAPQNLKIRPTTDSTKEFIFNYLGDVVVDTKVLDLFAGTGNLGIEALSRGAQQVIFIERNKVVAQVIHKNLKLTQFQSQSQVIMNDVFKSIKWLVKRKLKFDLIFADPPYHGSQYVKLLNAIDENSLLSKNGILIFEHQSKESMTIDFTNLNIQESKLLGNTAISFFTNIGATH